jgi:hypothetical protein
MKTLIKKLKSLGIYAVISNMDYATKFLLYGKNLMIILFGGIQIVDVVVQAHLIIQTTDTTLGTDSKRL